MQPRFTASSSTESQRISRRPAPPNYRLAAKPLNTPTSTHYQAWQGQPPITTSRGQGHFKVDQAIPSRHVNRIRRSNTVGDSDIGRYLPANQHRQSAVTNHQQAALASQCQLLLGLTSQGQMHRHRPDQLSKEVQLLQRLLSTNTTVNSTSSQYNGRSVQSSTARSSNGLNSFARSMPNDKLTTHLFLPLPNLITYTLSIVELVRGPQPSLAQAYNYNQHRDPPLQRQSRLSVKPDTNGKSLPGRAASANTRHSQSNHSPLQQPDVRFIASPFRGNSLVAWLCKQMASTGEEWSFQLVSIVVKLCNILLQLRVLTPFKLYAKPKGDFFTSSSSPNPSSRSSLDFVLDEYYTWTGNNLLRLLKVQSPVKEVRVSHLPNPASTSNPVKSNSDAFDLLQRTYANELDRLNREHELQLFKVRNQSVTKMCHLTDRIEGLEKEVEKYRILAGIEKLTKSSLPDSRSTNRRFDAHDKVTNIDQTITDRHVSTEVDTPISLEETLQGLEGDRQRVGLEGLINCLPNSLSQPKSYSSAINTMASSKLSSYRLGGSDIPRRLSHRQNTFENERLDLASSSNQINNFDILVNRPITKSDFNSSTNTSIDHAGWELQADLEAIETDMSKQLNSDHLTRRAS